MWQLDFKAPEDHTLVYLTSTRSGGLGMHLIGSSHVCTIPTSTCTDLAPQVRKVLRLISGQVRILVRQEVKNLELKPMCPLMSCSAS